MFNGLLNLSQHTINELLENREGEYLKHDERTEALNPSEIVRVYGSTIELRTKSSEYASNQKYWRQWVLLKDFIVLIKDKQISLNEAVKYALEDADVHISCDCPAYKYWAYEYMGTQLDYTYGPYRTNRAPTRNNTGLKGTVCKHVHKALDFIILNEDEIVRKFAEYYHRLPGLPKDIDIDLTGIEDLINHPTTQRPAPTQSEEDEDEAQLEVSNKDEAEQLIDGTFKQGDSNE